MSKTAAILGLGERGKLWAALFQDAGWQVVGFDPDPLAGGSNAPREGFSKVETISAAASQAEWVMICLPERLELVQMVIQRAQAEASNDSVIAVCSAVHDIEDIQNCSLRPGRVVLLRGRPQSGVDLIASSRNEDALKVDAIAVLSELGDQVLQLEDGKVQNLKDFRSA